MRYILRRAAIVFSSATLIFFWSCERHSPEELGSHGDHGDHTKTDAHGKAEHGNSGGLANEHGHDHSKPEAHTDGHDHGHDHAGHKHDKPLSSPAIAPVAGTPAQFFPPADAAASPAGSPR